MSIRAKQNAPPYIGDAPKDGEVMTTEQYNKSLQSIIEIVKLIIPDIPERRRLLEVLENIKQTK